MNHLSTADAIVIGGGIVGAACAHALSAHACVIVLEAEQSCGYHATGRSAALFSEYVDAPAIRALTRASRAFLTQPPPEVANQPLLSPRGVLALATPDDLESGRVDHALLDGRDAAIAATLIDLPTALRLCPVLEPQGHAAAVHRPAAMDIDVTAFHRGLLRSVRTRGGSIHADTDVVWLTYQHGCWTVRTDGPTGPREWQAPVVVNAAGAWADAVATMAGVAPVGLVPQRRTAVLVDLPATPDNPPSPHWPMVTDLADRFYFKPEGGRLLVSPADATPTRPTDAQPDEQDVATAVARLEAVTTLRVQRVTHKWAGLRTFAADGLPVLGAASGAPGFIWAAGLGGAGVQTAPAVGRAVAGLVYEGRLPSDLCDQGLEDSLVTPLRDALRMSRL